MLSEDAARSGRDRQRQAELSRRIGPPRSASRTRRRPARLRRPRGGTWPTPRSASPRRRRTRRSARCPAGAPSAPRRERSRISIHSAPASHTATCSNASRSKSAPSSAFSTASTFLLNVGGHPRRVVVRGDQRGRVLDQVGAEQEEVARPQLRPDPAQERGPLRGHQVPDRAAEEGDQPGRGRVSVGGEAQVLLEVGHHGPHVEPRVLGRQRLARRDQGRLADVDRDVAAQRALGPQRVEQQPGLVRRARAELDQGPGPGLRGDPRGRGAQDLPFGLGRVVLGQLGDLVEQRAALRVVEPLGRQRLRRPRSARSGRRRAAPPRGNQAVAGGRGRSSDRDPSVRRFLRPARLASARPGHADLLVASR